MAPVTPGEAALADVFAEVLGLDEVSVTASFFDMGGNSLSAMRLAARAADALGVAVSVRDVFAAPTIGLLAQSVAGNAATSALVVPVHPRPSASRCRSPSNGCGSSTASIRRRRPTTFRRSCA